MAYNAIQMGTVIAFIVTYFFTTCFLVARYFQSMKVDRRFDLDLVILTVSYGLALVYFITLVTLMKYGWGRHLSEVSVSDLILFNQNLLPNTLTYLITPAITKMGMLTVLFRINPSSWYRAVVISIGVAILAYTATLSSITGGPCNPLIAGTTQCLENVALAQAILNIASDFAVLAVPIPTIVGLMSSKKQKVSVGCILALGSGVVVCSIARLPYVIDLMNTTDATYTEAVLGIWSIVEVNLGITCGCAMRLKTLIKKYLPRLGLFSTSRSRSGNRSAYGMFGRSKRTEDGDTSHSYQLHSVQKSGAGPVSHMKTFDDYVAQHRAMEREGSTDKILD